jgi:hypothetical protein
MLAWNKSSLEIAALSEIKLCRFGLIVSQELTQFAAPVIYLYVDRFKHFATRRSREKDRVSRKPDAVELGVLPTDNQLFLRMCGSCFGRYRSWLRAGT